MEDTNDTKLHDVEPEKDIRIAGLLANPAAAVLVFLP
jgi:hypothetical protein